MKLSLITPFAKKTTIIAWLELNTSEGNFVILDGHAPTILMLSPNKKVTYGLPNGKQESCISHRGIADIQRETATLILDSMEKIGL